MYKLKHTPTGLYYQPHKHGGSNLSKRGKVYQTNTHGLSSAFKYAELYPDNPQYHLFTVYVRKDGTIHKQLIDVLVWEQCRWDAYQMKANTNISDWVIENIETN